MTILNNTDDKPVLPMTKEKAKLWLDGSKYKDIKGSVRYIIISSDFVTKGQVKCWFSKKYPDEEVRVIVHCGIITGGIEQYITRLTKFWVDWNTQLDNYSDIIFNGATIQPKNLKLYGGVPQVTEEFDTTQVCLFKQDSVEGEFTQNLKDENGKDKKISWKSESSLDSLDGFMD